MLDGYSKSEQDDLSATEKKTLRKLVDALKQQALDAIARRKR